MSIWKLSLALLIAANVFPAPVMAATWISVVSGISPNDRLRRTYQFDVRFIAKYGGWD